MVKMAEMAEMAINEVTHMPSLSHGVYRGIKRYKILMAYSDQMVLRGRMAINQTVAYLQTGSITMAQYNIRKYLEHTKHLRFIKIYSFSLAI